VAIITNMGDVEMWSITQLQRDGTPIAGYTTDDPRSHYDQPVWRIEEDVDPGDQLQVVDNYGNEYVASVAYVGLGWLIVEDHDTPYLVAVHQETGAADGLEVQELDGTWHSMEWYADSHGPRNRAELDQWIKANRIRVAGALHLPDEVPTLGSLLR